MQIGIKYLLEIPHIDEMQIQIDVTDIEKSHIFSLKDGEIVKHNLVTKKYLYELINKQVNKVTIIPDDEQFTTMITFLRERFPKIFPKPTNRLSLRQLETITLMQEEMNKFSDKKRYIYLLQEIVTKPDLATQKKEILIPYLTRLEPKIIQKIQKQFPDTYKLECLETEKGILIITISRDQGDVMNTIMAATDLVARLEKYFQLDLAYEIQEALDKFTNNMPRLVVFGNYKYMGPDNTEVINAKARYTYLELRNRDIYMKSLFIDQVNLQENREKLAQEILTAYNQPYSIKKVESKLPLKEADKKKFQNLLDKLDKYYTKEDFLKVSIQLKTLEPIFHVSFLKNQLANIHKLHSFTTK
ncbi:MAG: hypothetical protein JXJ04_07485 [Spirochaetales bacterium]|nr:hypothetical protein [Spirochaetales bacterium]